MKKIRWRKGGGTAVDNHLMDSGQFPKDALTGLEGMLAFKTRLKASLCAANEKDSASIVLVMLDIDKFVKINQEQGHEAGDGVLKAVTGQLSSRLTGGALFRYGGDQFAYFVEDEEKESVFLMMEACRKALGEGPAVSVSVGIAAYPEDGSRYHELVRKAEGAMHRAKWSGMNRVCLAREEKMVTKTSHYTAEQLQRLTVLAKREGLGEAVLLREALDDLLKKYDA